MLLLLLLSMPASRGVRVGDVVPVEPKTKHTIVGHVWVGGVEYRKTRCLGNTFVKQHEKTAC
jgi:hypothetical protein